MFTSRSIHADHKDLIHDVAYDFYGERLATCSSDQTVKVFINLILSIYLCCYIPVILNWWVEAWFALSILTVDKFYY